MSNVTKSVDANFIERKRLELTNLRETLRNTVAATEADASGVKNSLGSESREYEDDAQNLDALEKDGLLVNRSVERLTLVERALAKIEAGTYGFSDVSGEPIPAERLEAVPEAVTTIREQEASEKSP